jgi:hypothetical protein
MALENQCKFDIAQNSITDVARLSVLPHRAELFLERLANLDATNENKLWSFAERFRDLLPIRARGAEPRMIPKLFSQVFEASVPFLRKQLQPALRNVWKESVPSMKEAGLMFLAGHYMQMSAQSVAAEKTGYLAGTGFAGVPDKFLMVLLYALKHVHLLRYCANPDCKEPYFVGKRASQIFCSGPCAQPAQREAKLKWWREHGEAARRERLQKKRRGKHAKTKKA